MTCERLADILDAYLDGETDAINAREIEWHLADCPACARQLTARRALQQALRAKLAYHRAPDSLRAASAATAAPAIIPAAHLWRRASLALAACLALAITGLSYLLLTRTPTTAVQFPLAELIASSHLRSLQPADGQSHLTDVLSSDHHTVKPWFAGKLPFAPVVRDDLPDFPLIGGRLDMIADQPAAALVYKAGKHTINLFIFPGSGPSAADQSPAASATSAGLHEVHWIHSGMNYWIVSDAEPAELFKLATEFTTPASTTTTAPARTQ